MPHPSESWEETLNADEGTQENWRRYLIEFEEKIVPIMLSHGYSRDTALICWNLNRLYNAVEGLREDMEGQTD